METRSLSLRQDCYQGLDGRQKDPLVSFVTTAMNSNRPVCAKILRDFYGISPAALGLWESPEPQESSGFFHFGPDIVCYGKSGGGSSPDFREAGRYDALNATRATDSGIYLPFDFTSVIENLRRERYVKQLSNGQKRMTRNPLVRKMYYAVRELLPVPIRRHMQKAYLKDWQNIPFPSWPVDFTADSLHQEFLKLAMKVQGLERIPFIWFWPEGASGCLILTHDVETAAGRDFCSSLMDIDLSHGFTAAFQVVPEKRYEVNESYVRE